MAETRILGGHIHLAVVTPEGAAFDGPVDMVIVPGHDGEVAFLPGHAPFVGLLGIGELRFHPPHPGGTNRFFLSGGVVQVADNRIDVLADRMTPAGKLEPAAAEAELAAARALPAGTDEEYALRVRAEAAARARLRIATHHGHRLSGPTGPH